ncbi:hypothetical protein GCM10027275_10710 [Rhabdobacter roseus]|uniref:Mobilization protein n=1 Tax=Rhabdobacter roseus TaxID=1655419 RepID=A0A840TSK1_9BACT|nr:plasmid mobilization relaxosome protein MobC [Rhabdobacter roseus]MBB5282980.1 hypothetical protein [Rhabdobacter roseus]
MKAENNRNRWLHLRLTEQEYASLHQEYARTTDRKLSDFARRKLLGKPVTVLHRNQSLDGIGEELGRLRMELRAAGHNFNQAVKKLHTLRGGHQIEAWLLTYETQREQLCRQVERAGSYLKTLAGLWSRE